jgi:hypothetical protein
LRECRSCNIISKQIAKNILSNAITAFQSGDRKRAQEILSKQKHQRFAEVFLGSFFMMFIRLMNPETTREQDRAGFNAWTEENLQNASEISLGSMDEYEVGIIVGVLVGIHKIAVDIGSQYEQSWRFVIDEMQRKMLKDPAFGAEFARPFTAMMAAL